MAIDLWLGVRRLCGAVIAASLLVAPGLAAASLAASNPLSGQDALTSVARLLAGKPSDWPAHRGFAGSDAWREHRDAVGQAWTGLQAKRVPTIVRWRDAELSTATGAGGNLLYPFSGPDFLNAYLFFPNRDTYVMFGLEVPGEVPRLDAMNEREARAFLAGMRVAVKDLIERNYFITERMLKQLNSPAIRGTVPVLLATMGLLDLRVMSVEPVALAPLPGPDAFEAGPKPRKVPHAVKIVFQSPDRARPQTLYYLSFDATDNALAQTPEVLSFIAGFKPATTFIKSASYLLHGPYFTRVRDTLLASSDMLVQDDTGVPYRVLKAHGWNVRLYGDYEKPVRNFGRFGYQPDLQSAYQSSPTAPLPFPFGYHWSNGKSSLLVAQLPR